MDIEEFALGNSFVHNLDPRVKIVCALIFSTVVAVNHWIPAAALAIVFPMALIVAARINIRRVLSRLAVVNTFILFLWILLPFTFPGEVIYSLGPLEIHREGLLYALLITLKSNAIVLMMIALLGTSPVFNLVHALSHMGIPDKLVHIFFFCFRYIHVIHEEYHRLAKPQTSQGHEDKRLPGAVGHPYLSNIRLSCWDDFGKEFRQVQEDIGRDEVPRI